jgi:hypothetical protein
VERLFRLETFARAGFAARGIVYLALGYFAFESAQGDSASAVLERLRTAPAGALLIGALAFGLFGYGLFRLVGGVLDLDDEGRSAIGIVARIGLAISGVAHWLLCALALGVLVSGSGGSDQREEAAARTAFEYPGGALLVGIVGVVIIVSGLGQWLVAVRGGYMKFLNARQPGFARFAGALGYGARGAVFIVIGWQVVSLAIGWGGRQLGFDSAMNLIAQREWVFPCIAVGLCLFGIFSLYAAAHLRIRDEDVERRAKLAGRWLRG